MVVFKWLPNDSDLFILTLYLFIFDKNKIKIHMINLPIYPKNRKRFSENVRYDSLNLQS